MKIDLTKDEQQLLGTIKLEALNVDNGQPTRDNCERAAELTSMLLERKAIPDVRLRVFSKPEYATGCGPSSLEQFRRKGNSHDQMLRHPHFLKWLRYFVFGPQLPDGFIALFQEKVEELSPLTSGDTQPLRTLVRRLVREYELEKSEADEVFKLCLEFDDDVYLAKSLRTDAKAAGVHYRRR